MAPGRPPRQPPTARTSTSFSGLQDRSNLSLIDSSDDESVATNSAVSTRRPSGPRPSMLPQRRRRRSSCGRLSLAARTNSNTTNANLSELYQKALRLNAENKINAGNSWNLALIENMDKVVAMNSEDIDSNDPSRVNFAKASCTLDASVKIYGYRVDDVHLSSYKVLANLNRTDNTKPTSEERDDVSGDNIEENQASQSKKRAKNQAIGNTLETNIVNINVNKLDSAFDIDPLFHKMTKTFDEGGAKGLLLANLGVGQTGCNVVFDSSESQKSQEPPAAMDTDEIIKISDLVEKFQSLLEAEDCELFEMPLVPQLSDLRAEHDRLEHDGFCDTTDLLATVGPKTPGKRRYQSSLTDEAMADHSIHQLRSQKRLACPIDEEDTLVAGTPVATPTNLEHSFDGIGGFDDGDMDDDDDGFDTYIANINPRFSDEPQLSAENPTTQLLDAIASGTATMSMDDYSFLSQSNQWAGATHWKQAKSKGIKKTQKKKKKKPKQIKSDSFVSFSGPAPDMAKYLKKSKTSTQLSKTMIKKYTDQENVLPVDTKVAIHDLSKLFLRPDLEPSKSKAADGDERGTTVTFDLPLLGDDSNQSFGDDDGGDGPGFDFGGDDDNDSENGFFVPELAGVRKVARVHVGYATVAKKVDVKLLKKDLWTELEDRLASNLEDAEATEEPATISFQDAVREMEQQKTQADVTLPFYFICMLHLANEHGLRLEGQGLEDFTVGKDHRLS